MKNHDSCNWIQDWRGGCNPLVFFLKRTVTIFALKSLQKLCGCTKAGKQLKEAEYRNSPCSVVVANCL